MSHLARNKVVPDGHATEQPVKAFGADCLDISKFPPGARQSNLP